MRARVFLAAAIAVAAPLLGSAFMARAQVLFSPVEGEVTREGAPVAGAKVVRSFEWIWGAEKGSDSATTDAQGRFSFPVVKRSSFSASLIPHQPAINQKIVIEAAGQSYEAWMALKSNYDMNGEIGGRPLVLTCELTKPAIRHETHYGICELR